MNICLCYKGLGPADIRRRIVNFKIIHFFTLLLSLTLNPFIISAAEVYIWVAEKGGQHITSQPPEKPAKMIGKEAYTRDSPEEIRRYEIEKKIDQQQREAQQEAQRRYNQDRETSEKRFDAYRDQQKEKSKQLEKERKEAAIERINDLNAQKERLQAIENRDYREVRRLRLRDERRKIDRDINKYKEISD